MNPRYSITFFYYDDLQAAADFYEHVLGLELVLDQGMARIYRIGGHSYFGIVDGTRGHLQAQPHSAALLTLVDEDVAGWHQRLRAAAVPGISEILRGNYCEHFFFTDPGGYSVEIQRFYNPDVAALFR